MTEVIDELINQQNSNSLTLYILIFAIVVVVIVLGLEFWRNLFGMLGSPSLTFQRLIGEISIPPAIFVVIISGLMMAIILMVSWNDKVTGDSVVAQFNIAFDYIGEHTADQSILPPDINFREWFDLIQKDFGYALSFFVLMPVGCLMVWLMGSIGFHIASLLAGNKGGASLGGLLSSSAYTWLLVVVVDLFSVKLIYSGMFNKVLLVLFGLYFCFIWTILMREYGRYNYAKGFISFVIGSVLTAVFTAALVLGILWAASLIMGWLG